MLYSYIVKKEIRKTFDHVNNHRWDEAVKAVVPHVHHRVSGTHALSGERHGKEALRSWFERLGRVLPNLHIKVDNIWVTGWPWHTTVFAQWDSTATLVYPRSPRCARASRAHRIGDVDSSPSPTST